MMIWQNDNSIVIGYQQMVHWWLLGNMTRIQWKINFLMHMPSFILHGALTSANSLKNNFPIHIPSSIMNDALKVHSHLVLGTLALSPLTPC
jgi:hypothetical protein